MCFWKTGVVFKRLRCGAASCSGFAAVAAPYQKEALFLKTSTVSGSVWIPESLLASVVFFLVLLVFIVVISFYYC
tara:strand:+ start:1634 stop:1858 length:225 start_codon:yes stop_codon:yes gene_type:complete